jgi:hypothetical protein
MEKKNKYLKTIILLVTLTFYGCKTSNLPTHKKYQQMETFIEINGLKIPTLSDDKKFFKDTKAFKNDRKNSIDSGEASKMYSKSNKSQNEISNYQQSINDSKSYERATKDYLIVSENGKVYEDITYDESEQSNI